MCPLLVTLQSCPSVARGVLGAAALLTGLKVGIYIASMQPIIIASFAHAMIFTYPPL